MAGVSKRKQDPNPLNPPNRYFSNVLRRQATDDSPEVIPVVPTYSISFRLQRTTTEFAFVSVPVTPDLMIEQHDATGRIDVKELVRRAVEMGQAPGVAWHPEGQQVQPHPTQTPPPDLNGTPAET